MPRTQSVNPVEASRKRPGKTVNSRKARAALPGPHTRKNAKKADYVVVPVPLTGGRVRGAPRMSKDDMERVRSRVRGAGKRSGNVMFVDTVKEANQGPVNHIDMVTPGTRPGMPAPKPIGKPKPIKLEGGSDGIEKDIAKVGEAAGSALGVSTGAAIGTAVGGPAGATVGAALGKKIGGRVGDIGGRNLYNLGTTIPGVVKYLTKKKSKKSPNKRIQSKLHPSKLYKGEGTCGKCNECAH